MPKDPIASTAALLDHYSFDLNGYAVEQIIHDWIADYPAKWVVAAVVEAIYQGRYKVASVNKILSTWYLHGQPQYHFDLEFADLICGKLFEKTTASSNVSAKTFRPAAKQASRTASPRSVRSSATRPLAEVPRYTSAATVPTEAPRYAYSSVGALAEAPRYAPVAVLAKPRRQLFAVEEVQEELYYESVQPTPVVLTQGKVPNYGIGQCIKLATKL